METEETKTFALTGDEFLKVGEVAEFFLNKGVSPEEPEFVIFMGGVAAGKTTIRHENYASGYVHFDFGEIFNEIEDEFGKAPRLATYAALASNIILTESLKKKKNIVIEIIGETEEPIKPIIGKMRDLGYKVSLQAITCDVQEAYSRHIKAVEEDSRYISAHFTQEPTLSEFYSYFGLGELSISID